MIRSVETGAWKRDPFAGIQGEKVALIDADSMLYFSAGNANEQTFDQVRMRLDELLLGILRSTGCSRYAGFLTDSGNLFRSTLAKSRPYKGNRKGRDTPLLLPSLKAYAMREWGFYICPSLEADDCVAYHATDSRTVCSPDKDVLRQIPGRHFNYQRNEFVDTSADSAHRFLWEQTITGDSVDGVPGVPGLGPVKAAEALDKAFPKDYPLAALQCYLQAFDQAEAISRFHETYELVRLLSRQRDYEIHGLEPPVLNIFDASGKFRASQTQSNGSIIPSGSVDPAPSRDSGEL
jgi:hypothetical protein